MKDNQMCNCNDNTVRRNVSSNPFAELFGWPMVPIFSRPTHGLHHEGALEGFRKAKDGSYILHIEVPGIKAEQLEVEFRDGGVSVKGATENENDGEAYSNSIECFYTLPEDADTGAIRANLKDGVLTFRVPQRADAGAKKISIEQ